MKKINLFIALTLFVSGAFAQNTNVFPGTGNAGVGTTTPSERFEVVGNTKVKGNLTVTDTSKFKDVVKFTFLNDNSQTYDRILGINPNGKLKTYSNILLNTNNGVLDVNGNIFSSGNIAANTLNISGITTFTNKIQTNRIIPLPGDSEIHFGDSSVIIVPSFNQIKYGLEVYTQNNITVLRRGLLIGISGNKSRLLGPLTVGIGENLGSEPYVTNSIIIGNGG